MTNHPNRSRKVKVEFTRKELDLINHAIKCGAGDDGMESIGLSKNEQKILGRVGNKLLDLAGSNAPRFYE